MNRGNDLTYSLWGEKKQPQNKNHCVGQCSSLQKVEGIEHQLQKGELHGTEKITAKK